MSFICNATKDPASASASVSADSDVVAYEKKQDETDETHETDKTETTETWLDCVEREVRRAERTGQDALLKASVVNGLAISAVAAAWKRLISEIPGQILFAAKKLRLLNPRTRTNCMSDQWDVDTTFSVPFYAKVNREADLPDAETLRAFFETLGTCGSERIRALLPDTATLNQDVQDVVNAMLKTDKDTTGARRVHLLIYFHCSNKLSLHIQFKICKAGSEFRCLEDQLRFLVIT
jgi:hypothetical protein